MTKPAMVRESGVWWVLLAYVAWCVIVVVPVLHDIWLAVLACALMALPVAGVLALLLELRDGWRRWRGRS